MSRLVLVAALAVLAVGGFAEPLKNPRFVPPHKVADKVFLKKQMDILGLFFHIYEPVYNPEWQAISQSWTLEKNMDKYSNATAVKTFIDLMEYDRLLPRGAPFSVFEPAHLFEATTLYNVFFSAKDYETFFKTAVYMRNRVNELVFVYSFGIAVLNFPETQSVKLPPLYDVFPSFFNNGQVMATAQRLNTQGKRMMEYYPGTFLWNDNIVIRWNETVWPYSYKEFALGYFTHDFHLNALYYNNHIAYPYWLSGSNGPLSKLSRGEYYWFFHKQIMAHYYMERLSNGLGEIPELNFDEIEQGYESGLIYQSGVPFSGRPNYFSLKQPQYADYIKKIQDVESRIRGSIDLGYVIDNKGEFINIRNAEAIDILGKIVEGNVDSPNYSYYQSIITQWKLLLGNSMNPSPQYVNGQSPLMVPSALEQYQTSMRDPAFYMIWKRILKFFTTWASYLSPYKYEELALPEVKIEQVEVDKLVTYFENDYSNVTNELYMSEEETKTRNDNTVVLVQRAVLNHKPFNIRVHVKSDVAKKVVVRFYLAPKYDGNGVEIPLHKNTQNFFLMDQFLYDLPAGESVIMRESDKNIYMTENWSSAAQMYEKAFEAYNGKEEFIIDETEYFEGYPRRLMIPKGRVGGMPFVFMAYIVEYVAPKDPYGTGSNPPGTLGIGTGARRMTSYPLDFPLDRPLYEYQVEKLTNIFFEDVQIYHKETPELYHPFY